jgi:hypothetical protein
MTSFQVYMFTRLDHLIGLLQFWGPFCTWVGSLLFLLSVFILPICVRAANTTERSGYTPPEVKPTSKRQLKFMKSCDRTTLRLLLLGVFFCFITPLIPTKQEAAVIYLLPKICNSEIAQELPGDLKSLYDMAKEYLKSLAPKEPAK